MNAFSCILKSGVHLQTRQVSDPKVGALCSVMQCNGSTLDRHLQTAVLRLGSAKAGFRYSVEISLR